MLTMVKVCCDACLHNASHVPYWRKAAGASSEERQNWKASPLPIQPGVDMSGKRLARRDSHSIQQSQSIAEQAAECHVPLF